MLPTLTVDHMTKQWTRGEHAGRAIAARRNYLRKSGPMIDKETGGVIYPKLLSQLETGKKSLASLPNTKLRFLIRALEWTNDEFVQATGVEVGYDPEPMPMQEPYQPSVEVPMFDSVSAGLNPTVGESEVVEYVGLDLSLPNLRGRNPDKLVKIRVNGNSMVSPEAHQSIPEGSVVIVELDAIPENKDVVVAWVPEYETAVLKRFEEGPEVVLTSYNPKGPVLRASELEFDIRGVVRNVSRKP